MMRITAWDDEHSGWWFSVLDIVGVLRGEDDYAKNRNYWKYLKSRLIKDNSQLVSMTNQLKLTAADGKKYVTDLLDHDGIIELAKNFPSKKANRCDEPSDTTRARWAARGTAGTSIRKNYTRAFRGVGVHDQPCVGGRASPGRRGPARGAVAGARRDQLEIGVEKAPAQGS